MMAAPTVSLFLAWLLCTCLGLTLCANKLVLPCETKCKCYNWEDSRDPNKRFTANCTEVRKGDHILSNLPPNVTDLIVIHSQLPTLTLDDLLINCPEELLTIVIDDCETIRVDKKLFKSSCFASIRTISILHNTLDSVREDTFKGLTYVENIALDHNQIDRVYENAFTDLPNIHTINLSHNLINEIEVGSFKDLSKLEILDLSHNNLSNIHSEDFELRLPLTTLVLDGNPSNFLNSTVSPLTTGWEIFMEGNKKKISQNTSLGICTAPPESDDTDPHVVHTFYIHYAKGNDILQPIIIEHYIWSITSGVIFAIIFICVLYLADFFLTAYRVGRYYNIGQLIIDRHQKISQNIFQGKLKDGRLVAVKQFLKTSNRYKKELDMLLRTSNSHQSPNVIHYLLKEEDSEHCYLALELCDGNLQEAMDKGKETYLTVNSCLKQLTTGLKHIHRNGIQHRDIKPRNILLKYEESSQEPRFIIADFDLGHFEGKSSLHKPMYGTEGWAAPELWTGGKRTTAVDIFSLGCVFCYVLTGGKHPFGEIHETETCQQCICDKKEPNIDGLRLDTEFKRILAEDLIWSMIQSDASKRPKAKKMLHHPLFWNEADIRNFYIDTGRLVPYEATEATIVEKKRRLRNGSKQVYQGKWIDKLDELVQNSIHKKKDKEDICDLLREVRNKIEHFKTHKKELQQVFHNSAEGVARYFNEKFPRLLLYTYKQLEESL